MQTLRFKWKHTTDTEVTEIMEEQRTINSTTTRTIKKEMRLEEIISQILAITHVSLEQNEKSSLFVV